MPAGRTPSGWGGDPGVVALGGGHGLAASLSALRRLTADVTAVVTVADNGGSSGRLREEFGVLPPGDLRMALAALCGDDRWGRTWAQVLQHRFETDGEMNGHALGNLLLITLWDLLDDHVDGLEWVAGLLGAHGRVLPMSLTPLDIVAEVAGLDGRDDPTLVRGQVQVATTPGRVQRVRLDPHDAPACPEAVQAVLEADLVVLGPGSWFSSVIPHLLVPQLLEALCATRARVVVTTNLEPHADETRGHDLADHLDLLRHHAPDLHVDVVLADPSAVRQAARLDDSVTRLGARLELVDLSSSAPGVHDHGKLARAYTALLTRA